MKSGLVLLALWSVAAAQTKPAADPLDGLVADSPFLPAAGGRGVAGVGAEGPLELRGIVFDDGAYRFSVYDQASREATWVRLDERGLPFVARSFNRERDALTVEHRGRTLVLELQPARMASGNAGPPPSPSPLPGAVDPNQGGQRGASLQPPRQASGGPGGAPPAANAPGAGPPSSNTTAAEAQRLQNLADEIRRRRGSGSQLVLPKKNP
jgi:hypothetical protein